ncbi:hypothetical protein FBQ99_19065 [Chloroflexi bacterium CFX2]|nr:hypothetical protein [Chloroflexi bacterium CFX2]
MSERFTDEDRAKEPSQRGLMVPRKTGESADKTIPGYTLVDEKVEYHEFPSKQNVLTRSGRKPVSEVTGRGFRSVTRVYKPKDWRDPAIAEGYEEIIPQIVIPIPVSVEEIDNKSRGLENRTVGGKKIGRKNVPPPGVLFGSQEYKQKTGRKPSSTKGEETGQEPQGEVQSYIKEDERTQANIDKFTKETLPEAGLDKGTGVSLVGTLFEAISEFSGLLAFGAFGVACAMVSAYFNFQSAARAQNSTKHMTELLAVAFATTAWMFDHPSPQIPRKLLEDMISSTQGDVREGWKKVYVQQKIIANRFDELYVRILIEASARGMVHPTREEVKQEIRNRIKMTPTEFARMLLLSEELTSMLTAQEKNAKRSMWYDFFAKIPYEY